MDEAAAAAALAAAAEGASADTQPPPPVDPVAAEGGGNQVSEQNAEAEPVRDAETDLKFQIVGAVVTLVEN